MRQIIPSFANGFYSPWRATGEALYPNLWRGCVGAWNPAIGPSGLTLFDWSGLSSHGTITDATWIIGKNGYELSYNGSTARVNVGNLTVLDGAKAFTLSVWAKCSTLPFSSFSGLFSRGSTAQRTPWFFSNNSGSSMFLQFETNSGAADCSITFSGASTSDFNLCATWNGSTVNVYVNGAYVATDGTTGNTLANTDGPTYFGFNAFAYWSGTIGPVQIWNEVKTPNEIALLASDPHAPYRVKPRRRAVIAAAAPAGVAPTSHLYGSLVGPLGGPV